MMYVRFPLSLRNVEDLLHESGVDICHESVRLWVDRFGTHFAKNGLPPEGGLPFVLVWRFHRSGVHAATST